MRSQLAMISLVAAASQLAAFVKLWFVARIFGVGAALDGYNLALIVPSALAGALAGLLQTGLFPIRAKIAASDGDVQAFERSVLLIVAVLSVVLSMALVLASGALAPMLAARTSSNVLAALSYALPLLAPLVALNLICDCSGFLLAMRDRFVIAAAAPIANSLFASALLALWPEGGLANLVWGTVLGLAVQLGICLWGLQRSGFRFGGGLLPLEQQRRYGADMLRLATAILPGVAFSNLLVSMPSVWMTGYGEGAVSAFGYAYRLHSAAMQLLIVASSTVVLVRFSDLVARNEWQRVKSMLGRSALFAAVMGGTGFFCVWLLGSWALQLIFSGRFDAGAAEHVARHWLWLTVGLPFGLHGIVLAKLWQAQRKPYLSSFIAATSLAAAALTYFISRHWLLEYAVPAGFAAASAAGALIGWQLTYTGKLAARTALRTGGSANNSDASP